MVEVISQGSSWNVLFVSDKGTDSFPLERFGPCERPPRLPRILSSQGLCGWRQVQMLLAGTGLRLAHPRAFSVQERSQTSKTRTFHGVNGLWGCRCTWANGKVFFFFPNGYLNLLLIAITWVRYYFPYFLLLFKLLMWQILHSQKSEGLIWWAPTYSPPRCNTSVSLSFVSVYVRVCVHYIYTYIHYLCIDSFSFWLNLYKACCERHDTSPIQETETAPAVWGERIYSNDLTRYKVIG